MTEVEIGEKAQEVLERMSDVAEEINKAAIIEAIQGGGNPADLDEIATVAKFVDGGPELIEIMEATWADEHDSDKKMSFLVGVTFGVLAERGRREQMDD